MSANKVLQPSASSVEQPVRSEDGAHQSIPLTLCDRDLMTIIGRGATAFYKRKARGEFAFLELRPQLSDSNTIYSGHLVTKWLRGELVAPRFFGRATSERPAPRRPGRPRKGNQSPSGIALVVDRHDV